MSNSGLPNSFPCNECQAGVMHAQYLTFFTWLGDELITVPNFPAWVCDFCGRREYDDRAIAWLSMLLNPDAGKSSARQRIHPPAIRKSDISRPSPE